MFLLLHSFFGLPTVLNWLKNNASFFDIAKNVFTIIAFIVGGIWSYMLFVKKRPKYPCANITHCITHRPITEKKILLNVDVGISNVGAVLLSLVPVETRLLQVVPPPSDVLDDVKRGINPVKNGEKEIQWPIIDTQIANFEKGRFEIEPCEQDHLYYDFIVGNEVESIEVYTYFKNETKGNREIGWGLTTVYDLCSKKNDPGRQKNELRSKRAAGIPDSKHRRATTAN